MKKTILFLMLAFACSSYAQEEAVNISTPQASSLIKFIDNPVSYDRGMVDISIPLYEITFDGITIPVKLSYHHGGLKANEESHWLGVGWTLIAEPSIARKVNGKPDPCYYNSPSDNTISRNYQYYEMLNSNGSIYDEAPDEYYYRLPEKQGAFLYKFVGASGNNKTFKAVTLPYEPLKINRPENNLFEITDDAGICYRFGKSVFGSELVERTSSNVVLWKCTEIVSASKKDTVAFQYFPLEEKSHYTLRDYCQVFEDLNDASNSNYPHYFRTDRFSGMQKGVVYNGNFIEETASGMSLPIPPPIESVFIRNIRRITFPSGCIEFVEAAMGDGNYLESIQIKDKLGNRIRKYTFNNTFISSFSRINHTFYCPVLRSVDIQDNTGTTTGSYSFEYNGNPIVGYSSGININFWGYRCPSFMGGNGASAIQSVQLPVFGDFSFWTNSTSGGYEYIDRVGTIDRIINGGERIANVSQTGMLTAVTYPTGGRIEYYYENSYYKGKPIIPAHYNPDSPQKLKAGMLRIREIRHIDPVSNTETRRVFKYGKARSEESDVRFNSNDPHANDEESGLGHMKRQLTVQDFMTTQIKHDGNSILRIRTLLPYLHGDRTLSGVPLIYHRVTEYVQSYKNNTLTDNGKTVYIYNYPSELSHPADSLIEGTDIYLDTHIHWSYGKLIKKEMYKRENTGNYSPVSVSEYMYSPFYKDGISACRIFQKDISNNVSWANADTYKLVMWNIKTGAVRMNYQIDSIFTDNGIVKSIKEYSYANQNHLYPTQIKETNSDGIETITTFKYPQDSGTYSDTEHIAAKNLLVANNKVAPVLEQKATCQGRSFSVYNGYKVFPNGLPLLHKKINQYDNKPEEIREIRHNYDSCGNPLYITKNDADKVVYLWGYNHQYPIAEIKNATYDQIKNILTQTLIDRVASAATPAASDLTQLNNLRSNSNLQKAEIITYEYKPLVGMTKQTSPQGIVTTYEYDAFGRLQTVKDHNGNQLEGYDYHYKNP
jgi:YD repeat-containing protein